MKDASPGGVPQAVTRPVWMDLVSSAFLGLVVPALVLGRTWLVVVLFSISLVPLLLAPRARRRVTDDRSVGAQMGRFFALWLPMAAVILLLQANRDQAWTHSWWVLTLAALFVGGGNFAYLRLDQRYQNRRLEQGDFRSWDLS